MVGVSAFLARACLVPGMRWRDLWNRDFLGPFGGGEGGTERDRHLSCKRIYYFRPQFSWHHCFVRALSLLNVYVLSLRFLSFKGQMQETIILLQNKCLVLGVSISTPCGWRPLANGMIF